MIKLVEVISTPRNYNPQARNVESTYKLREFYVNPAFVVSIRDDESVSARHKRTPLIEGLDPTTRFSKLLISSGGASSTVTQFSVVGSPDIVNEKLVSGVTK